MGKNYDDNDKKPTAVRTSNLTLKKQNSLSESNSGQHLLPSFNAWSPCDRCINKGKSTNETRFVEERRIRGGTVDGAWEVGGGGLNSVVFSRGRIVRTSKCRQVILQVNCGIWFCCTRHSFGHRCCDNKRLTVKKHHRRPKQKEKAVDFATTSPTYIHDRQTLL